MTTTINLEVCHYWRTAIMILIHAGFSGSVIERIRLSAFIILAVVLGSVVWIPSASRGWHPAGWMVTK